jgi:ketosteroid isomerase-like protein
MRGERGTVPVLSSRPLSTLELVQLFLVRFGSRDAAGVARLFAPRVDWRMTDLPPMPRADGVRSRREVESYFIALFTALAPEALIVSKLVVDGDDAIVLGRARCRIGAGTNRDDRLLLLDFVISMVVRDGQIREHWLLPDTLAAALATGHVQVS